MKYLIIFVCFIITLSTISCKAYESFDYATGEGMRNDMKDQMLEQITGDIVAEGEKVISGEAEGETEDEKAELEITSSFKNEAIYWIADQDIEGVCSEGDKINFWSYDIPSDWDIDPQEYEAPSQMFYDMFFNKELPAFGIFYDSYIEGQEDMFDFPDLSENSEDLDTLKRNNFTREHISLSSSENWSELDSFFIKSNPNYDAYCAVFEISNVHSLRYEPEESYWQPLVDNDVYFDGQKVLVFNVFITDNKYFFRQLELCAANASFDYLDEISDRFVSSFQLSGDYKRLITYTMDID